MKKFVYHFSLSIILLLTGLSVYGAFLGAERARIFFTSIPLMIVWAVTGVLLIVSMFAFRMWRKPAGLLMHLGAVLVILGSMSASETGHRLRGRLTGHFKPVQGRMMIYEGQAVNELVSENKVFRLPFAIRLDDFFVETYAPVLIIRPAEGGTVNMPAKIDTEYTVPQTGEKIQIVRTFENLKITFVNGKYEAIESMEAGRNPAVEVEITRTDGSVSRQFVFELPGEHSYPGGLQFSYHRPVKDFVSRVDVVNNGTVVRSADIEVNHPLHFGGYHFYQYSFDDKQHRYTILQAVSDSGLNAVYAGYGLLCAGVLWHFWFIRLRRS